MNEEGTLTTNFPKVVKLVDSFDKDIPIPSITSTNKQQTTTPHLPSLNNAQVSQLLPTYTHPYTPNPTVTKLNPGKLPYTMQQLTERVDKALTELIKAKEEKEEKEAKEARENAKEAQELWTLRIKICGDVRGRNRPVDVEALKEFSRTLRLESSAPRDLIPLLTKDRTRQQELRDRG